MNRDSNSKEMKDKIKKELKEELHEELSGEKIDLDDAVDTIRFGSEFEIKDNEKKEYTISDDILELEKIKREIDEGIVTLTEEMQRLLEESSSERALAEQEFRNRKLNEKGHLNSPAYISSEIEDKYVDNFDYAGSLSKGDGLIDIDLENIPGDGSLNESIAPMVIDGMEDTGDKEENDIVIVDGVQGDNGESEIPGERKIIDTEQNAEEITIDNDNSNVPEYVDVIGEDDQGIIDLSEVENLDDPPIGSERVGDDQLDIAVGSDSQNVKEQLVGEITETDRVKADVTPRNDDAISSEEVDNKISISDLINTEIEDSDEKSKKVKEYVEESARRLGKNFTTEEDPETVRIERERFQQELEREVKVKRRRKVVFVSIIVLLVLCVGGYFGYGAYRNYQMTQAMNAFPMVSEETPIEQVTKNPLLTNEKASLNNVNEVIGYIQIPAVDLKLPLIQGESNVNPYTALSGGFAHDPATKLPGEKGKSVIAAHREGDVARIKELKYSDLVIVTIGQNVYLYEVSAVRIIENSQEEEESKRIFAETEEDSMIMYTCYPFGTFSEITGKFVVETNRIDSYEKTIIKHVKE